MSAGDIANLVQQDSEIEYVDREASQNLNEGCFHTVFPYMGEFVNLSRCSTGNLELRSRSLSDSSWLSAS